MPAKRKSYHNDSQPALDSLVRHNSSSSNQPSSPSPQSNSTTTSPLKISKKQLRHYHLNARRTKIHLILDQKAERNSQQKNPRKSRYFMMSEDYKRKMSDLVDLPEEQPRRKISWGQESQFVLFNKNKSCQAIRIAPRHKFSVDE